MKQKILLVDDEPDVLELLEFNLEAAGYSTVTAVDGADALAKARRYQPSLIIMDVMMPEMNGLEACKVLRRDPNLATVPIILLTARAGEIDRVLGLELGANDYLTKPFSPRELVLRVKELLRRTTETAGRKSDELNVGGIHIQISRHEVRVFGKTIDLTVTEFKLLTKLAENPGRVHSREQLLRDVWEYQEAIDSRTVDTHMRRLREKLGSAAASLVTVRGVGYRFMDS